MVNVGDNAEIADMFHTTKVLKWEEDGRTKGSVLVPARTGTDDHSEQSNSVTGFLGKQARVEVIWGIMIERWRNAFSRFRTHQNIEFHTSCPLCFLLPNDGLSQPRLR